MNLHKLPKTIQQPAQVALFNMVEYFEINKNIYIMTAGQQIQFLNKTAQPIKRLGTSTTDASVFSD